MNYEANMNLVYRNNVVAVGEVTIDNTFVLKRVMVISTKNEADEEKWFVALPDEKRKDSWIKSVSLTKEEKEKLDAAVIQDLRNEITRNLGDMPKLDITVLPVSVAGSIKASVKIKYGNGLEISNIRIMEGKNGLFVVFPSTQTKRGYIDIVLPTASMVRDYIDESILEKYRQMEKTKEIEEPERIMKDRRNSR